MADLEQPLPHNLEAERAILGAVLLKNSLLEIVAHAKAEDFFLPQHRYIFRTMLELYRAGSPIDTVILKDALIAKNALEQAGGEAYLSQLPDLTIPRAENVTNYIAIVTKKAALRRLVSEAYAIEQKAREPDADPAALQRRLTAAGTPAPGSNGGANGTRLDYGLLDFLAEKFPEPEHLIGGLIPRGGSAMIVAMPHHLKSWFTLAMVLGSSVAGQIMGKLEVPKPVRTYYLPIEDHPGEVQWRVRQLMRSATFGDIDPKNIQILPRPLGGLDIMDEGAFQKLLARILEFKAEHIILDVLRRAFRGDINSPKESAALCEQFDRLRDLTGAALTIVHHENRKEADIMRASAGSFNFPSWANVMIQFKRKVQQGSVSHVEIEVDNKLAQSPEPARMVLDVAGEVMLRLEAIEDSAGLVELREKLSEAGWTWRDLAEALEVPKTSAYRRLKKLLSAGIIEKIAAGKRHAGGLARYTFVDQTSTPE